MLFSVGCKDLNSSCNFLEFALLITTLYYITVVDFFFSFLINGRERTVYPVGGWFIVSG